jgi:hypothetical protein
MDTPALQCATARTTVACVAGHRAMPYACRCRCHRRRTPLTFRLAACSTLYVVTPPRPGNAVRGRKPCRDRGVPLTGTRAHTFERSHGLALTTSSPTPAWRRFDLFTSPSAGFCHRVVPLEHMLDHLVGFPILA